MYPETRQSFLNPTQRGHASRDILIDITWSGDWNHSGRVQALSWLFPSLGISKSLRGLWKENVTDYLQKHVVLLKRHGSYFSYCFDRVQLSSNNFPRASCSFPIFHRVSESWRCTLHLHRQLSLVCLVLTSTAVIGVSCTYTDSRHPVNNLFTQYNKTIFLERVTKLLCDAWTGLFLLESFLIWQFTYRSEYTDSYPVAGRSTSNEHRIEWNGCTWKLSFTVIFSCKNPTNSVTEI